MAGRDVEKVMERKDTITISQMISFKGRRYSVALFYVRASPVGYPVFLGNENQWSLSAHAVSPKAHVP